MERKVIDLHIGNNEALKISANEDGVEEKRWKRKRGENGVDGC